MRHWLRSYALLLKWNLLRVRARLPFLLIVQTVMAAGVVVGFSFLIPGHDVETAIYLSTGAPTIALITVGMVLAPQMVAFQRTQGLLDFLRSMPVPRMALLAADASVWVGITLPGVAAAMVVAALRFDLPLAVSPLVVPAVLLVALAGISVGYAIAYLVKPELVGVVANMCFIVALMFAPVNYPAERLPDWLATLHQYLPFQYMAQVIRETANVPATGISPLPFLVLAVWCVVGLLITSRIMVRRV